MWVCFNVGICYSFPPYHLSKGNEAENHDASRLGPLLPSSDANMSTRLDHCHFPYQCLASCRECGLSVKFTSTNLVRNLNRSSNVSMAVLTYSLSLAICGFGELRDLAWYSLCLLLPLLTIIQHNVTNISQAPIDRTLCRVPWEIDE